MKEYLAARTRMDKPPEDSPRPLTAAGLVPVADYHSTEGSVPGVGPEHNREVLGENTPDTLSHEGRPRKRRRQLPLRFRAPSLEMHDAKLHDVLPQPAPALPPAGIEDHVEDPSQTGPSLEDAHTYSTNAPASATGRLRKVLETTRNSFGVFRRYFSQQFPSHDPESEVSLSGMSDAVAECPAPSSYGPYPNKSSFRLGDWYWNDGVQKSQTSFKQLVSIVGDPDFEPSDVRSVNWDGINKSLADEECDGEEWVDVDAGWKTSRVEITVPFHRYTNNPGPCAYRVADFHHRSLVSVIKEKLASDRDNPQFHYEPYELLWRPSEKLDPLRLHGELYTSPAFIDAHNALQEAPAEPGCELPRVVVALMFWSDSTQLTSFGNAKLWPLYMFFGNESKYRRGKPSCNLCEHVAYFETLPDSFTDFAATYTGNKKLKPELIAHCGRELTHAQWEILLDDEFLEAYRHGIVVKCCDGIWRRFYPCILTYSADYPEKILMATIRNRGLCPCPRCTTPLSKTHLVGTASDRRARVVHARVDDLQRRDLVSAARELIHQKNFDTDSAAVERLLKVQSLVPTSNAFSRRLSQSSVDFITLFLVDLMHEVELGVWKMLFIHLLRLLEAVDANMLHELDRRFRLVPTFGVDTIRRFSANTSELKRLAARNYEDFLQCAIPVFEGLFPEPHNSRVLRLLFTFAHWHGLAKLRLHTDATLTILDDETTKLGKQLRDFRSSTCAVYKTRELKREMEARQRRDSKKPGPSNHQKDARRLRTLNLHTYKFHSLGDYVATIKRFGTTDSYTTSIGELEHRKSKAGYKRTSKKAFVRQLAQIERRQTHIRLIRQRTMSAPSPFSDDENVPDTPEAHHHIGVSENCPVRFATFLQSHVGDPALMGFWTKLKIHLLGRIRASQVDAESSSARENASYEADSAACLDKLFFKKECMYKHNIMRINYTTYDVRRGRDIINPNTDHKDIILLSTDHARSQSHQFIYARVLGIYHVNVIYTGSGVPNYAAQRMEFLWVRWFANPDDLPVQRSWGRKRLDCLQFLPVMHKNAFGFVDPANVLRSCQLIPRFAEGRQYADGKGISGCARDGADWRQYFVGRFVDRDMVMRHHWGLAVGHVYSHARQDSDSGSTSESCPNQTENASNASDDEEIEQEAEFTAERDDADMEPNLPHSDAEEDADRWLDSESSDAGGEDDDEADDLALE